MSLVFLRPRVTDGVLLVIMAPQDFLFILKRTGRHPSLPLIGPNHRCLETVEWEDLTQYRSHQEEVG